MIFILGTDPERCAELKVALQARISDTIVIVTPSTTDSVPPLKESDTVIISSEDPNLGLMDRHLLNRLEVQGNRAKVLGELIRLSMTLSLEKVLEQILEKSTEVLGDTALIVLESDELAFCTDKDRLIRMLMTAFNLSLKAVTSELLRGALDKGEAVVIPNLPHAIVAQQLRLFVDKYALLSLIATPIRGRGRTLGAFISMSTAPNRLSDQDVAAATELADFTAMVIENARLATTDPLTGLYNKRLFDEVLNREVARSRRHGTTLSLLMIDVDNFKKINDTYGHPVGDKVLVEIGGVLHECVRNTDIVFRYGGDEFAVIPPNTTADGALRVAQKILDRVHSGDILQSLGYSGTTTVSIGIAEYGRGSPSDTLVRHADHALLDAKRVGKNTIRIFGKDSEK
jgi:diguanylate cyclase (GGDEF)-like protein